MKRFTKFANTLPREHRNTPWAEFVPPVWGKTPPAEWIVIGAVSFGVGMVIGYGLVSIFIAFTG